MLELISYEGRIMSAPTPAATDLPEYPLARECPYRPSRGMDILRGRGPISPVKLYNGRVTWLVTGPVEARALLADPRTSIRPDWPRFPILNEEMAMVVDTGYASALFGVDPPEHTRQRRMLTPAFTTRRIATLRPAIEDIVDGLLDDVLRVGPPADLVSAFAAPVPMMAVSVLLGVPFEESEAFQRPARDLFVPERAEAAMAEMTSYLDGLIIAKENKPGEGLLDELIAAHVRSGELERTELVQFAMAMLVAGTDTTANVISLGVLALLDNPDQYAALAAHPELAPTAVEELLRYISLVEAFARVATHDIEIGGLRIKAGDGLLISSAGANFDAVVAPEPQRLDVSRPATHHLAFGYGVHHCIGANLARLELEIVFRQVANRIPTLRTAVATDEIPTHNDGTVQRLLELPVTW